MRLKREVLGELQNGLREFSKASPPRHVNNSAAPEIADQVSIREALASFRALASDDEWATLNSIVQGRAELDPFLRGILNR
jgi:hypothetical protein